jgi:hypothetical protein
MNMTPPITAESVLLSEARSAHVKRRQAVPLYGAAFWIPTITFAESQRRCDGEKLKANSG